MEQFFKDEWALISPSLGNPATWFLAAGGAFWAYFMGQGLAFAGLAFLLSILMVSDARTQLIPLAVIGAVALLGLGVMALHGAVLLAVLGGVIAWVGMLLMGILAQRLAGKPALGAADVWLSGALGLWLGVWGLVPWLVAVAVLGLALVVGAFALRRVRGVRLPFAPALCVGAFAALLHGQLYYAWVLGV